MLGVSSRFGYAALMRETTDERLMQQYANGDTKSFDQLYSRHRGALYRYFLRQIKDTSTANDLYQGVWEKIIRARLNYKNTTPFTAWMYRIAHNHLVDHYRRQKPEGQLETAELTDNRPLPPQQLMADQQSDEMYNRISELPEEQRNTLLLKLEAGLKMEEIATVTGVSRETVKSRLRYAVSKLKRSLVE
jgi:RNA polymerase sigma-70 factor (ECF subfamily)